MKIVPISKSKSCGEMVIHHLEKALEFANERPIDNVAVIMLDANGEVLDCWANKNSPFVMVGAIESLKIDFMNACIEGR